MRGMNEMMIIFLNLFIQLLNLTTYRINTILWDNNEVVN